MEGKRKYYLEEGKWTGLGEKGFRPEVIRIFLNSDFAKPILHYVMNTYKKFGLII